jgi:hypothetical protein
LGVIGGSRLHAVARKELPIPSRKKSRMQILGLGLVWVGILVWVPYFYLKVMSRPVDVMDYLPYHLISMLGGIVILVISHFLARNGEAEVQDPVG